MDKKVLLKKISKHQFREVLDELLDSTQLDDTTSNSIVALSARYEDHLKKLKNGTRNYTGDEVTMARFINALISIVRSLPDKTLPEEKPVEGFNEELITILQERASLIKINLPKLLEEEFEVLHQKHIGALQKNNLIFAHELLMRIHDLIYGYHFAQLKKMLKEQLNAAKQQSSRSTPIIDFGDIIQEAKVNLHTIRYYIDTTPDLRLFKESDEYKKVFGNISDENNPFPENNFPSNPYTDGEELE